MIRPPSKETWVLMLGLSALAGGLGSRRLFRTDDGVKNVEVAPKRHDFGKVRQGLTLERTFRLANGGEVPIVITKTESSCGCTTVKKLEGSKIAPGAGLDLPISLNTGPGDGPESGQITLYYRSGITAVAWSRWPGCSTVNFGMPPPAERRPGPAKATAPALLCNCSTDKCR